MVGAGDVDDQPASPQPLKSGTQTAQIEQVYLGPNPFWPRFLQLGQLITRPGSAVTWLRQVSHKEGPLPPKRCSLFCADSSKCDQLHSIQPTCHCRVGQTSLRAHMELR